MPWNDNANPGPWGSPPSGNDGERKDPPKRPTGGGGGPRRPSGPGGSGGGPDFNAGLNHLRDRMRGFLGGPGAGVRPGAIAAVAGAAFALWALSGLYQVASNEEAVVTRFGAFDRVEAPGLRYHLPSPLEHVEKVAVTSLNRLDIGGNGTADGDIPQESLMLTSDENIVDLDFSVTWRVANAAQFVFTTRAPDDAVKSVAESAMREVIGKTKLDVILTNGRSQVQLATAELMQKTLDSWGAGVTVVEVQIRNVNPPAEVSAAFRDVQSAQQDRDSAVNEADAYHNRVTNEAKGDAAKIIQSAEGYREQSVRTATGDAARFNSIYNEYKRAPQATRDRLYLETMERVLAHSNKVVISGKGVTAPVILPSDVFRPRSGPNAAPVLQVQPTQPQVQAPGAQQ